jgi:hypothetical protein
MTSAPHQPKPSAKGGKVTQYLIESKIRQPRTGILRKRVVPRQSPNLFPGVDDRRSSRWLWILWLFPIGAVVAYVAAHMGATMVEGDWMSIDSLTHTAFCTVLDMVITYGAEFDTEAERAGCP